MSALESCPLVIFIAYTVPQDAEPRGYSQWLRDVDMPFFNAIPGTGHYANWRVGETLAGDVQPWDYFDFQGVKSEDDLERVWFSPELDEFRKGWLKLWGYGGTGGAEAPPVLRHAYLMRRVGDATPKLDTTLTLSAGTGAVPGAPGDVRWQVEGILHKHFGGASDKPWLTPVADGNPLGFDWVSARYGNRTDIAPDAGFACRASLIAAPDRTV
ncbi:hypothetical protein [Chachezhania sediminis]|uniref:hypothetical protein n=1 Tax=Chachezhania sediminis TaxID=2599291 RepID=UPI00131D20DD|nr:hypothetical protein [Chachezhania sediminis]